MIDLTARPRPHAPQVLRTRTGSTPGVRALVVGVIACALASGLGACSGSDDPAATPQSSSGATTSGGACGVRDVGEVQVRTFCGSGTATVEGGTVDLSLPKAECETAEEYIAVNAGTIVLGADAAATEVKATTQYIGLTVGRFPGDTTNEPAPADGTYSGGILGVNDRGIALLPDVSTLEVTLTGGRTAGTFEGKLTNGQPLRGSFACA